MATKKTEQQILIDVLIRVVREPNMRSALFANPEKANGNFKLGLTTTQVKLFVSGGTSGNAIVESKLDAVDKMIAAWATLTALPLAWPISTRSNCFPGCGPHLKASLE